MSEVQEEQELDLFLGSKRSYDSYKRKNKIQDEEDLESKHKSRQQPGAKQEVKKNVAVLSLDNLKPISDDVMKILRRTITINPYEEVMMQSSLEFYDQYYNDTGMSDELKEARQIRFMYRSYSDYLNAIATRNRYIDSLVEKYGGEDAFNNKLSIGLVKDWIPPLPTLSKKAADYELYLAGIVPLPTTKAPDGTIDETLKAMQEDMGEDVEFEYGCDTVPSIGEIRAYEEAMNSYTEGYTYTSNRSTINDLEELNKVFRSWYKKDSSSSTGHELFKNAPENIRKRFLEYCSYNEPGLLARLGSGEEIPEPTTDPNEMVHDAVTGRTMSRKELESRQQIRAMADAGWSESRLLNYANVGSSLEIAARKPRKSRKRRNIAVSEDLYRGMDAMTGIDPMYTSDNDALIDQLTAMMRGD